MLTLTESFTNENLEIENPGAETLFFEHFSLEIRTSRASGTSERLEIGLRAAKKHMFYKAKTGLFRAF